jgi:predicted transcriptional regulator
MFTVSSRRTSLKYAEEIFSDAISLLEKRYFLFRSIQITIHHEFLVSQAIQIQFTNDINHLHKHDITSAIESLIRFIYEDISEESGLYFITEIKNSLRKDYIDQIQELGIDLDHIQSEQHLSYTRKKRKREAKETGEKENSLGYKWDEVSNWKFNEQSKSVNLYDHQGNILDTIDLEQAIKHYVVSLSGGSEMSAHDLENLLKEHEKSYSFLKLIYQENLDFETAKSMLNLSENEIFNIIKELIEMKFLQYVSEDEVELTQSGKEFVEKN